MTNNELVLFWMLFGMTCLLVVVNGRKGYWKGKHSEQADVDGWADEAKFWRALEVRKRNENWVRTKPSNDNPIHTSYKIDTIAVKPLGVLHDTKETGNNRRVAFFDKYEASCELVQEQTPEGPQFRLGVCGSEDSVHLNQTQLDGLMLRFVYWAETGSFAEPPRA